MQRLGMLEDPAGAFVHPRLPEWHRLGHHLLYRITRQAWCAQA